MLKFLYSMNIVCNLAKEIEKQMRYLLFLCFTLLSLITYSQDLIATKKGDYMTYKRNRYFIAGEDISKEKMISLLQEDKEAYSYYQKSRDLKMSSDICSIISIAFSTTSIITSLNKKSKGEQSDEIIGATFLAGVASLIPAIVLNISSNRNKRRAFETYNQNQERKVTLKPIIGENSMGVAVKF